MFNRSLLILSFICLISCTKEIIQQKLTVSVTPANGGSVSPPSNSYEKGSNVSLVAAPAGEYIFKQWQGSISGTSNPTFITMDADKSVTGVFEKRQYPLTLTIEGSGTIKEEVIAVAPQALYPSGTTVRLTPQPTEGWGFTGWSGDLTSASNPLDLKIDRAINLKALFQRLKFNVVVENSQGGKVNLSSGEYIAGTELNIEAIPNNNYHFLGFEGFDEFQNKLKVVVNKDLKIKPIFIVKHDGKKRKNSYWFNDSDLDFLASENYVVWWDKKFNSLPNAMTLLSEFENISTICKNNGWDVPFSKRTPSINGKNNLMSIYLYEENNNNDLIWKSNKARCCGVGGNELEGMPYSGWSSKIILKDKLSGKYVLNNNWRQVLYHEGFHMMQFSAPLNINGKDTFPYSLHNSWYTESTASWFGRKYGINYTYSENDFSSIWNGQPAVNLQPQVSMWGGLDNKPYFSEKGWSYGNHRYAMEILFKFLIENNHIKQEFLFDSFKSKTTLTAQEYYIKNVPNFKDIYGQFASQYVSGIMFNDIDFNGINKMINWWLTYSCTGPMTNCNLENNTPHNNQFVKIINEQGTGGYVTPIEKNEAWSWTVVKIRTQKDQKFQIDFKPDQLGNERTLSSFTLYLTNRENKLVQKVDYNDPITIKPNLDYFLIMVNTPQRFEGWETFDYKLKVIPIN